MIDSLLMDKQKVLQRNLGDFTPQRIYCNKKFFINLMLESFFSLRVKNVLMNRLNFQLYIFVSLFNENTLVCL